MTMQLHNLHTYGPKPLYTKDNFVSLEIFEAMKRDVERFISQPAVRETIENHKSNWIADSKGGEPNCRR